MVKFFRRSRDGWRCRALQYRRQKRSLEVRVRDLEISRDHWRGKYFQSRTGIPPSEGPESEAAAEPPAGSGSGGALVVRAKERPESPGTRSGVAQREGSSLERDVLSAPGTAARHHYDLASMRLSLDWVCEANTSLRGASRCFAALAGGPAPSCWTIRLWVLRVGLYELTRPKELAPDWAFIVDATIGIGEHKAVVVLGVRLAQRQRQGFNLGHQDVIPLEIRLVTHCPGEVIQAALQAAAQAAGVPRMVVSDGGSEVKKGVRLFQAEHPQVVWHYDVSHAFALLVEKELGGQRWWARFITRASQCRQACQQTAWSHLLPPGLRLKARWLNIKPLVNWALKVLGLARRQRPAPKGFARLFSWLKPYQQPLREAFNMLTLLAEFSRRIKHRGLNRRQVCLCEQQMNRLGAKGDVRRVGNLALAFLYTEAAAVPRHQTHLASSDVLESLFGKYKAVVERSPLRALTEMVLELAAFTSSRTEAVIRQALECVSTAKLATWFQANGQPTLLAKRRQAFA